MLKKFKTHFKIKINPRFICVRMSCRKSNQRFSKDVERFHLKMYNMRKHMLSETVISKIQNQVDNIRYKRKQEPRQTGTYKRFN